MLVMHSLGYFFKPGGAQGIVKTGVIYIATVPKDASVYLGKKRFSKKTPTILHNLIAGEYPVKLVHKGYKVWQEMVPVLAGKATVLDKIVLLPQKFKKEKLVGLPFESTGPVLEAQYFILFRGERVQDVYVYPRASGQIRPLFDAEKPGTVPKPEGGQSPVSLDAEIASTVSVPESPFVLFRLRQKGGDRWLWVRPRERESEIRDVSALFIEDSERVEWAPGDERYLFSCQKGYCHRLDTQTGAVSYKFFQDLNGGGFFKKAFYGLQSNGIFFESDLEGKDQEVLLRDPALFQSLFDPRRGWIRMAFLSKDLILFLQGHGKVVSNRLPYHFVEEGVLGFEFDPKKKRVLLWTKEKIGILDFSDVSKKRAVFEKAPQVRWVYEEGSDIHQAFWVHQASHILFRDGVKVEWLELDAYQKPEVHHLLEVKGGTSIHYLKETGELYALDPETSEWISVEILPRGEMAFLSIPEFDAVQKKAKIQVPKFHEV